MAAQQGIEGTVQVIVSLDADSHVVGARLQSSPSAILNAAAIAAARESTFQTEIRNCQGIAADYIFSVEFDLGARFSTTSTGERIVTVTGSGTVKRTPDSAHVIATIVTHDDAATGATAKNDAAFAALKAKLAPLGVRDGDVNGMSSLQPVPPHAFRSTRAVAIAVDSVPNAVHVAAAAAAVASVNVSGIRYELTDREAAYRDAMALAVKDGENSAQGAVSMQRLRLGPLKQVTVPPPTMIRPYVFVTFHLVAIIGGFTEPDIQIPEIPVRAIATVTYAVMP
jgi:uncharacterized protein YggE